MDPADPDIMHTAMEEAMPLASECGQDITMFTNDQQLYRVAVKVMWVYPDRFPEYLDSKTWRHAYADELYIGCFRNLMTDSGLEDVMKVALGSLSQMPLDQRYPQNFRSLRIVIEKLPWPILDNAASREELKNVLKSSSAKCQTVNSV